MLLCPFARSVGPGHPKYELTVQLMNENAALVVAHPGHELRVHSWLESRRPEVCVLTDGSGAHDAPRTETTAEILSATGAGPGPVFGRFSDRQIYHALLEHRSARWVATTQEIASWLVHVSASQVVSDSYEGFNPSHDLCFLIVERAARLASEVMGTAVLHWVFPLEGHPQEGHVSEQAEVRLELDDLAWRRKLKAARAYSALRPEVDRALENHGMDAFRFEVLQRPLKGLEYLNLAVKPSYESYGEKRVREGRYPEVIRREQHMLPAAAAIQDAGWPE